VVDDTVRVISNEALSQYLCQIDRGEMVKNGHIAMVLVGALIYVIGAVTFLFPEKMYFLGSRWRYKNAELSDDGNSATVRTGVFDDFRTSYDVSMGSDGEDIEGRLRKLQSLYQQGLITAEEYEKKKQELLDRL